MEYWSSREPKGFEKVNEGDIKHYLVDKVSKNSDGQLILEDRTYSGQLLKNADYNKRGWFRYQPKIDQSNPVSLLRSFVKFGQLELVENTRDDSGKIITKYPSIVKIEEVVDNSNTKGLYVSHNARNVEGNEVSVFRFIPLEKLVNYDSTKEPAEGFAIKNYFLYPNYTKGIENIENYTSGTVKNLKELKLQDYSDSPSMNQFIINLANRIKNTYEIPVEVISAKDVKNLGLKDEASGFIYISDNENSGKIYLNKDKINNETLIHEMGHLFLSFIKSRNYDFYNQLLEKSKQSLEYNDFKDSYKDSKLLNQDKEEEIFVSLFSKFITTGFDTVKGLDLGDMDKIKEVASELFNIESNKSGLDLMKMNLNEAFSALGSDLFINPNKTFDSYSAMYEIEAMAKRAKLVEDGIITEKCE